MGLFGFKKRIEGKTAEEWFELGLKRPGEENRVLLKMPELDPKDAVA